jgi:nucleoside-diphosphate-sugar epimerase
MNILVTGGLGFIGHEVVKLLQHEHTVTVVDSLTDYGFIPNDQLQQLIAQRRKQLSCDFIQCDIRDKQFIDNIIATSTPDVVIHLASFPRQKVVQQNPSVASEVMSTGLINLLEASKGTVSKFVYISSSMVYGDFDDMVKETVECNPRGQYAIMKYMGEKLVEDYKKHFDYTIIRPSAVYGPRDVEDRVLSKFVLGALRGEVLKVKGATEILDFTYSTDTAQGIALAATKACKYDIYNITRCESKPITLEKAALTVIDQVGGGMLELLDRDLSFPSRGRLDTTRAIRDLGYTATVDFNAGCQQYVDWVKLNEQLYK